MKDIYLYDDMIDDDVDDNNGIWFCDIIDGEAYSWYFPNPSLKYHLSREDFAE